MAKKDKALYFTTGVNVPDGDGEQRFEKGDKVPGLPPAVLKTLEKMKVVSEENPLEDEVVIRET